MPQGPDLRRATRCGQRNQGELLSKNDHAAAPSASKAQLTLSAHTRRRSFIIQQATACHSTGMCALEAPLYCPTCGHTTSETSTNVCSAATKRPRRQEPATLRNVYSYPRKHLHIRSWALLLCRVRCDAFASWACCRLPSTCARDQHACCLEMCRGLRQQ